MHPARTQVCTSKLAGLAVLARSVAVASALKTEDRTEGSAEAFELELEVDFDEKLPSRRGIKNRCDYEKGRSPSESGCRSDPFDDWRGIY